MVKNTKLKYILIITSVIFIQFAHAKKLKQPTTIPDDLNVLSYRVSNHVYHKNDLDTVDKYLKIFFSTTDKKSIKENLSVVVLFSKLIETTQIPRQQISLLNRFAIALSGFKSFHRYSSSINNIIWWCEARTINDDEELLTFLKNQMLSSNYNNALKMLIEKGKVDEIKNWKNKFNIKDSELIIELSLRQAKVNKLFQDKPKNLSELLLQELNASIIDLLPIIEKTGSQRNEHLIWLIKQLGVHNSNQDVKQILTNLVEDDFYYNKNIFTIEALKKVPHSERDDYISVAKERMIISIRAKEALNPYEIIKQDVIE